MSTRRAKRGDTFFLTVTRMDDAGAVVNLTGTTVAAKMRSGAAEITLTAQVTNAAGGTVALSAAAAATELWTPGLYNCDVEFTTGADVTSSDTFRVLVVEDVTF